MKVNFTETNMARLKELAIEMLLNNGIVSTKIGQVLNVSDLLHTTTINTLNSIKNSIKKRIEVLEGADEWTVEVDTQREIGNLKKDAELVNLIIGYKRYTQEIAENHAKKRELEKQLHNLEESTKTPAERIEDLKKQIEALS
jgi:hypothetical protein